MWYLLVQLDSSQGPRLASSLSLSGLSLFLSFCCSLPPFLCFYPFPGPHSFPSPHNKLPLNQACRMAWFLRGAPWPRPARYRPLLLHLYFIILLLRDFYKDGIFSYCITQTATLRCTSQDPPTVGHIKSVHPLLWPAGMCLLEMPAHPNETQPLQADETTNQDSSQKQCH